VAGRTLAIREAATPWEVLVAEVMSHQTGIERVGPYWRSFIARWPTPDALANAGTRELLEAWAGLGYNRRALALRATAERIVIDHDGVVPRTVEQLEHLPGIGPYTARAIAATAFGVPVAPLDVNVARVVGRTTGRFSSSLQEVADDLVARTQPRRWLNAVMDLAATVCTKAAPRCPECPLREMCATQGVGEPTARQGAQVPFPQTRRWLRGRLLAMLREAPHDQWQVLPDRLGTHDGTAIVAAAEGLAREGFIEMRDRQARIRV
jgi:A/G-specific adenine glycosylase